VKLGDLSLNCRLALARGLSVISLAVLTVPINQRAEAGGPPVLVAAGDIATCNGSGDEVTARLLDGIPGRVATLGDHVYQHATADKLAKCYASSWGRHAHRTRPAVGNHDYLPSGAPGYYGYFGARAGPRGLGYYSYELDDWHVVVLNSNCGRVGGCGRGSPQERWLRADLADHRRACTVAYWHHPRFSSGANHGSDRAYEAFWDALYDFGADVVMGGHDHLYERFAPQTPTGRADPDFGIRQFVVGTGGAAHYGFRNQPAHNSQARNGNTFGVLKLILGSGGYDWQFVAQDGKPFRDAGSASCHGAPPDRPTTPPTSRPTPPTTRPTPPTTRPAPPPSGDGIVFRGSESAATKDTADTISIDRPAGTKPGDVMVASVAVNDSFPELNPPPGWTLVSTDEVRKALRQDIFYRVARDSDPSSFTWKITSSPRLLVGAIAAYGGVDTAHPIDAHGAAVDADGTATPTTPSIRTTADGARLLALVTVNSSGDIAPPSGMTERSVAMSSSGDHSLSAVWSDEAVGRAGSTGERAARSKNRGPSIAALLALRPAR
jgi:calcineurin-like phosphoesterase family protein